MIEITGIEHEKNSRPISDIRALDELSIKLLSKDGNYTIIELKDDTIIYVEESIKTLNARIEFTNQKETAEVEDGS